MKHVGVGRGMMLGVDTGMERKSYGLSPLALFSTAKANSASACCFDHHF